MKIAWLSVLLTCSALCAGVRHSLQAVEPTRHLDYNPDSEIIRDSKNGALADLLKEFKFSDYSSDSLRAAAVNQLSPVSP